MTTNPRNTYSRPTGRSTVRKTGRQTVSQQRQTPAWTTPKKSILRRPTRSIVTNNSKDIKIGFGHNPVRSSMHYYPTSYYRRQRYDDFDIDPFTDPVYDWHQPSNLDSLPWKSPFSPVRTPPRLRSLLSSPGIRPYRNPYNIRRVPSPLPSIDFRTAPMEMNSLGLDTLQYSSNPNLHLARDHPSPLYGLGLARNVGRQKKPYIVVPHLNSLMSPPISTDTGNPFVFSMPPSVPIEYPEARRTYLQSIHSFTSPEFLREPSDYVYLRQNDAFANHYVDDFIDRSIRDHLIPDLLLEVIGEINEENRGRGGNQYRGNLEQYYSQLNQRPNQNSEHDRHLFSDDWIRQLDYQRPAVVAPTRTSTMPPIRPTQQLRYNELPDDVQGRLLADINQELIDFEIHNMSRELSDQALNRRIVNLQNPSSYRQSELRFASLPSDRTGSERSRMDPNQSRAIDEALEHKFLDTALLDRMMIKYLRQHGDSAVENDELFRLLDGAILENLMYQHQHLDHSRSNPYATDNYY